MGMVSSLSFFLRSLLVFLFYLWVYHQHSHKVLVPGKKVIISKLQKILSKFQFILILVKSDQSLIHNLYNLYLGTFTKLLQMTCLFFSDKIGDEFSHHPAILLRRHTLQSSRNSPKSGSRNH